MLSVGQHFEGLQIESYLGESPICSAFTAKTLDGTRRVLKLFKDALFTQPEGIYRLRRVRDAISHGKISNRAHLLFCKKVATAEVPGIGKRTYLLRQFGEGINLADWREKAPDRDDIPDIIRKICMGLNHLHQAGLIHGSLSPENVIIGEGTVKLTDFCTGSGYLSAVFKPAGVDLNRFSFVPPWHDDPQKLHSPGTDIYALGALLLFLNKGTWSQPLPADSLLIAEKALRGDYRDIASFLKDFETVVGQWKFQESDAEKQNKSTDHNKEEAHDSADKLPESAPRIDIEAKGLVPDPAGVSYQLTRKRINLQETVTLIIKNGEKAEIRIRATIQSGTDWIQMDVQEILVPPGEQAIRLTLGPTKGFSQKTGRIVLQISIDGTGYVITREIRVSATFLKKGILEQAVQLLVALFSAFGRIRPARFFIIIGVALAVIIFYITFQSSPNYETILDDARTRWSQIWQGSNPPETETGNSHSGINLADQLVHIQNNLLNQGELTEAAKKLRSLDNLYPENSEIKGLLNRLYDQLDFDPKLVIFPGQYPIPGEEIRIASGSGYHLNVTCSDTCYLYIYQLDSKQNIDRLFPNAQATGVQNPLLSMKAYKFPDQENWFVLDENTGHETIFIMASRFPAYDMDELFTKFNSADNEALKDEYLSQLLQRFASRKDAGTDGLHGCFYEELAFYHE